MHRLAAPGRARKGRRAVTWGSPVTLTLRLAKDSPLSPVADPQQPAMLAEGKAVSYRYTDPWALITMIQRQREPDGSLRANHYEDRPDPARRWVAVLPHCVLFLKNRDARPAAHSPAVFPQVAVSGISSQIRVSRIPNAGAW